MIDFIDLFAGLGGIRIGFTQAANDLGLETRCVFTSEITKIGISHQIPIFMNMYNHNNVKTKK